MKIELVVLVGISGYLQLNLQSSADAYLKMVSRARSRIAITAGCFTLFSSDIA